MPLAPPGKRYRLNPTLPVGALPTYFDTFAGGVRLGLLGWRIYVPYYPGQDSYSVGDFILICNGDGTYRGLSAGVELEGTCVEVPPP